MYEGHQPHSPPLLRAFGWVVSLLVAGTLAAQEAPNDSPAEPVATPPAIAEVLHIRFDSAVHPVSAEFVEDAVAEADRVRAQLLVIELATPGGLLTSTRDITTAVLNADTPVAIYVSPAGSQAASAGFFMLMSADIAAMAPGTNTGAAHPVAGGGEDIEGDLGDKAEEDAAATIRSLAERHGRNVEAAEAAVLESTSFSADEALAENLIDLIAPSLPALLDEIDGREVEKNDRQFTLATAAAPVREVTMSPMRRALSVLADPNIASILMTLGFLGLYFELMNPGSIFPGVVGALCLILAFFGLSVLPFNAAGLALIVLAVILFVAEVKVVSFGMLTVAGVISLVLGFMMLFKDAGPALQVSTEVLVAVAVTALAIVGFLMLLVIRTHRQPPRTGREGLVGASGRVLAPLAPRGCAAAGKVFVQGEIWDAVWDGAPAAAASARGPLAEDEPIEVVGVEGMLLHVRPLRYTSSETTTGTAREDS
ncbi:MAG: nodulation protein NfeD [Acidobacteriota bacterium]